MSNVAELVLALRAGGKLAPRTIHHVAGTLHAMFAWARRRELIEHNPVDLDRGVLPKKADADPTWRRQAIYTRAELEQLISDQRLLAERRVLYALKGLALLRHGEAARLRWCEYDRATEPLDRLDLDVTKTKVPRACRCIRCSPPSAPSGACPAGPR